jgi:two-component system, LytTR family, sensor kinase
VRAWFEETRLRRALALLALFASVGLVQGLMRRSEAGDAPVVGWHVTGAIAAWLAFPAVAWAVRTGGPHLRRAALVHVAGYLLFTSVHVVAILVLRAAIGIRPGAALLDQVAWEAQADLVLYAALAAGWSRIRAGHERQRRELASARAASQLAEARLAALTAQLDPHFMFNALNAVGATMHADPARAEQLLENIAEMLRASLDCDRPTWSFSVERAHTERYLEVLAARFGTERLHVTWEVGDAVLDTQIPRFAVQSLVDNAVTHNRSRRGRLCIGIEARARADGITLVVEDDGIGFPAGFEAPPSRGISRLREMLALLFGPKARLELSTRAPSGARVEIALPGAG